MGSQLALRLLNAGYDLAACNRTRSKAEPLAEHGAKIVDRPADLADRDIVCIMVGADKELESVINGEGGLLHGDDLPMIVIDASTVSTEASARIRASVEDRGAQFLAAPVSGNPKVVAAGKLTVAVSGPRAAFDAAAPLLGAWGHGVTYVGEGETARLVKIAHNVFLGVVSQSLAEITVLAERGGVPRAAFLEFLNDSVLGSTFTRYKSPALVNLDFHPTFTNVLLRKDLQLGLSAGRELGVPMPLAAAADMLIAQAIGAGYTADDFATLVLEQARRSGYAIVAENVPVDDGLAPEVPGGA
jgi:3-hydroxyisobutyrate dehydrogenase-like beta-hydroxyacid dehydrogenase